jgi:hypothetical protein
MNRSMKTHSVPAVMLLTVAALLAIAPGLVFAGPPRVFRVICNKDCGHVFGHLSRRTMHATPRDVDFHRSRLLDPVGRAVPAGWRSRSRSTRRKDLLH